MTHNLTLIIIISLIITTLIINIFTIFIKCIMSIVKAIAYKNATIDFTDFKVEITIIACDIFTISMYFLI